MTTRVAIGRLEEIIKAKTHALNKVLIGKKDHIEMDEKGKWIQKKKDDEKS